MYDIDRRWIYININQATVFKSVTSERWRGNLEPKTQLKVVEGSSPPRL